MTTSIFTYEDAINHGLAYIGGDPNIEALRDVQRSIDAAYRDLTVSHNWSYLLKQGRVFTSPTWGTNNGTRQLDGTIASPTLQYVGSGGTYPNQVTITGDVWPDWAGDAYLRIGLIDCAVDRLMSANTLTLDPYICPPTDYPAGTSFILYRDSYVLPDDFTTADRAIYETWFGGMAFVHPREWVYSKRWQIVMGLPQWFCVPTTHEILTQDGWKFYEDVVVGENALGYNHETGEMEWQPVESVHVFDFDGDLLSIERPRQGKKFLCTENHRWPIEMYRSGKRKFVEAKDLTSVTNIPTTGNFRGEKSIISPRLAAIIGWAVTDGYGIFNDLDHWNAGVYQSPKRYLDEIISLLGTKPRKPQPVSGCVFVPISKEDRKAIRDVIRTKEDLPLLAGRLSREAAESMLDAMFKAEGWTSKDGQKAWAQYKEENRPVADCFQILCFLTGRSFNLNEGTRGRISGTINASRFLCPGKHGGLKKEYYKGKIWCPKLKWGTWVMRHKGHAIITGNTLMGSQKHPGKMVMRVSPIPVEERTIDFLYKRKPRGLTISVATGGTVSISSTVSPTTVTGVGTAFAKSQEGSIIRFSQSAIQPTSGVAGSNIAVFESIVDIVHSATSMTIRDSSPITLTGVNYTISDPVDIEQFGMIEAFLRCIEKHLSISRNLKDRDKTAQQYNDALSLAKEADSRCFAGKVAQAPTTWGRRLRDIATPYMGPFDGLLG